MRVLNHHIVHLKKNNCNVGFWIDTGTKRELYWKNWGNVVKT